MACPDRYKFKKKPQHGFSLLELVIVISIISLLFVLAVDRLLVLKVDAERVSMESVAGTLRSALGIEVATHIARGKIAALAGLENSNPMDTLAEVPKNYKGPLFAPDPALIEGGNWYFDTQSGTLVYRVENVTYFKTDLPGPARARFQIKLVYEDINANGTYDTGIDKLRGLRLAGLDNYRWTNEPATIENGAR